MQKQKKIYQKENYKNIRIYKTYKNFFEKWKQF